MTLRILAIMMFLTLSVSSSEPFTPRNYYGARLEPEEQVLHGAGQVHIKDVAQYRKTLESYDPVIFMDYSGVKNDGAKFAEALKKKLGTFPKYTVVQLGLTMTRDGKPDEHYEHNVAAGIYDKNLYDLFTRLKQLDVPFYIRIGFECNGKWNGYAPDPYKKAFIHVTQIIRKTGLNAATVWCPHPNNLKDAMRYYPGDEWVDWWAVDVFKTTDINECKPLLNEAHKHNKPVMIGESTPRNVGVLDGKANWNTWFDPFFRLIRTNPGIKAFCYINWNWAEYPQWKDWGDARLQMNKEIADLYRKEMDLSLYLHASTRESFRKSTNSSVKFP
jgi:Glycosyl hydrolase family 26